MATMDLAKDGRKARTTTLYNFIKGCPSTLRAVLVIQTMQRTRGHSRFHVFLSTSTITTMKPKRLYVTHVAHGNV